MRKTRKIVLYSLLAIGLSFGVGRGWYRVTDGFRLKHIQSTRFQHDPRLEMKSQLGKRFLHSLVSQPYRYLGKGCQSYVFLSDDKRYVLKFFKYKRFRPSKIESFFTWIPRVARHYEARNQHKRQVIEDFFGSVAFAYAELKEETGLLYLHLNKTDNIKKTLTIFDKIGFSYELDIDQYEFFIQRAAVGLQDYLDTLLAQKNIAGAKQILSDLMRLVMRDYKRGYVDLDHALLQNTGVVDGNVLHIDVGQFMYDPRFEDPKILRQEFYNRFFRLQEDLQEQYPELSQYVEQQVRAMLGEEADHLVYIPREGGL